MKKRYTTLVILLFPLGVYAQGAGLSFLKLGPNAAALGLGTAQTAYTHDAFATYWNPAGLAATTSNSAGLNYTDWLGDIQIYAIAARFQSGKRGGFGLAITTVSSGDLEARDAPGEPSGLFNAQFVSAGLSYARAFGALRVGITTKFLSERIFTISTNGYAFDAGLQLDLADQRIQLGAVIQHLGKIDAFQTQASDLPRTLRAGLAIQPFQIMTETAQPLLRTHLMVDWEHGLVEDLDRIHLGLGGELLEILDFRLGWVTNVGETSADVLQRFTFGAGLRYQAFRFDYAYLPFEAGFGTGQALSLLYGW